MFKKSLFKSLYRLIVLLIALIFLAIFFNASDNLKVPLALSENVSYYIQKSTKRVYTIIVELKHALYFVKNKFYKKIGWTSTVFSIY